MKNLLREPVVQFALFGVALFVYFDMTRADEPVPESADQIVLTDTDAARLIEQYRTVWRRPPTREELEALIDAAIREEVMVREAMALGLDQNDAAIRNRLRQKLQFLTESAAQSMMPEDETLATYLADNADLFTSSAKLAFEQIYLGTESSPGFVAEVQQKLRDGMPWRDLGQPSLLPDSLPLSTREQVDGVFGRKTFASLQALPAGEWAGPVGTGYGLHLVRVTEVAEPRLPELDQVRDKVLFDWRRDQAEALSQAQYEGLRSRYRVDVPDAETLTGLLAK